MAIYSCSISNVSRGSGSNSCATLSYIAGEKVHCDRTNENFNYGRKERVVDVETLLPKNAPEEYKDPAVLFNAIENFEKSENARPAKKIIVALPREFDRFQRCEVMREFCKQLTKQGYACTFAIHEDKDGNNPHAHVLVANRPMNSKGEFVEVKQKMEYVLDDKGERVPLIDKETGEQKLGKRNEKLWKRQCVKCNPLDQKQTLKDLRASWANICNAHLKPENQITEKSHEERGLKTEPTIHEGYAAREIERRGGVSDRCEFNREIKKYNSIINSIQSFQSKISQLAEELKQLIEKRSQTRNNGVLQPSCIHRGTMMYLKRKEKNQQQRERIQRFQQQQKMTVDEYKPKQAMPQQANTAPRQEQTQVKLRHERVNETREEAIARRKAEVRANRLSHAESIRQATKRTEARNAKLKQSQNESYNKIKRGR